MNKEILKQIGFLDAEVDVYQALLRKGPALVSELHQTTGHHRTHIYDLLEKLREKGLVSVFIQAGKKHFQAASPQRLLAYMDERKKQVESLLPDLEELIQTPREAVNVELFKGKEGLKTVLQDVLRTGKNYCVMGSIKQFEEILEYALPSFLRTIEKKNIKERVLCDTREKIEKAKIGTYRALDGKYLFPSSFWVYGDKVAFFVWTMPYFAIVIESNDVAKTYQAYFEFFWKIAKPM
ncbi:MAG: helix-turn-helix domain-containing protein [Nanoarchaeota archaeon]